MSKLANNKLQDNSLVNNKIQTKKPEVGDVWLRPSGVKYHITEISSLFIGVISESLMGYAFPKQHLTQSLPILVNPK